MSNHHKASAECVDGDKSDDKLWAPGSKPPSKKGKNNTTKNGWSPLSLLIYAGAPLKRIVQPLSRRVQCPPLSDLKQKLDRRMMKMTKVETCKGKLKEVIYDQKLDVTRAEKT